MRKVPTHSSITRAVAGLFLTLLASAAGAQELLKLIPGDGGPNDEFGRSVALDGPLALVGASGYDGAYNAVGAAYVFDAHDGRQLHQLLAADGELGDRFGTSVALEGSVALIGCANDDEVATLCGSVYVYDAVSGSPLGKLLPPDGEYDDGFGGSVSIDAGVALVGSTGDDDNGDSAGSAYLFDVGSGQLLHKLLAGDGAMLDRFGCSVCVSGPLAIVGAYGEETNGTLSGAVYVFRVSDGQELHKLTPADGEPYDWFGWDVGLDGQLALIGSHRDGDHGHEAGAAYLFDAFTGQELLKLTASDAEAGDNFGTGVALAGGLALVGSIDTGSGGIDSGAAYIFDAASGAQRLKLVPSDGADTDFFAYHRSLVCEGGRALVGSMWDDAHGSNSGSAYVFVVQPPGSVFCLGDSGSGVPCPCNNDNDGSVPGSGCASGVATSGARLRGTGTASRSADDLVLSTTGLPPNQLCLVFQGNDDLNGGAGQPFGDGLRCAGGAVIRLETRFSSADGVIRTTVSIAAAGGASAGDTRRYQTWYEDTSGGQPCGVGVHDFNLSNGYEISWVP